MFYISLIYIYSIDRHISADFYVRHIHIIYKTHIIGIFYVISHGWGGGHGNDFGKDRLFLERKPLDSPIGLPLYSSFYMVGVPLNGF